jgi:hypothetical protein
MVVARPVQINARAYMAAAVPGVDISRVRITELPGDGRLAGALRSRRIGAFTIGRRVFAAGPLDELESGARELLVHELVHVRQASELGLLRFGFAYLAAYLRGRRRGLGHQGAYRAIPFEVEAYELAASTSRDSG